jgi:hypothetical protein
MSSIDPRCRPPPHPNLDDAADASISLLEYLLTLPIPQHHHECVPYGHTFHGHDLMGVYLIGVYLMGVYLIGLYLTGRASHRACISRAYISRVCIS